MKILIFGVRRKQYNMLGINILPNFSSVVHHSSFRVNKNVSALLGQGSVPLRTCTEAAVDTVV